MNKKLRVTLELNATGEGVVVSKVAKVNEGLTKTRRGVASISEQLELAKKQFVGFFAISGALRFSKSFISTADNVKLLTARLRQATGSQQAFNTAQADAKRIAKAARADYLATVSLMAGTTERVEMIFTFCEQKPCLATVLR